jgi:2-oxo-4-hydroxy-4-carboxy-5-ureidoimidazoline decarboxylase
VNLEAFNAEHPDTLTVRLLACCDAPSWADAVEQGRPYADTESLYAVADRAARRLTPAEVKVAVAAHPRIGERPEGEGVAAAWSRAEQSALTAHEATQDALAAGNRAYEDRFGHVFLICATGLSAEEILADLERRLDNDNETEAAIVADELRKIALLRLRKVLDR